jgi:hypothetical protein
LRAISDRHRRGWAVGAGLLGLAVFGAAYLTYPGPYSGPGLLIQALRVFLLLGALFGISVDVKRAAWVAPQLALVELAWFLLFVVVPQSWLHESQLGFGLFVASPVLFVVTCVETTLFSAILGPLPQDRAAPDERQPV